MSGPIDFGKGCYVPRDVATCPECNADLTVRSFSWDAETGKPHRAGIDINCDKDPNLKHRWWQTDWQPVVDAIRKWTGAAE